MNTYAAMAMIVYMAAGGISTGFADDVAVAGTRESFNQNWRFARFGDMPDGSRLAEPGMAGIGATASSEEEENGNFAARAFDGNSDTRWCAANGGAGQWLRLDLGRSAPLSAVEVEWESAVAYPYKLEASADGSAWRELGRGVSSTQSRRMRVPASGSARYIRLTVEKTTAAHWASVREMRCLGPLGAEVRPLPPDGKADLPPSNPAFRDSGWRLLNLPHDFGIEGPFRMDLPNETGRLPWNGIAWYRKSFTLPDADRGRRIYLDFDGSMSQTQVWLNGKYVGEWPYGYTSFRLDLTPYVQFGKSNVLAARIDNPAASSRWYPGGGIYRNVWLVKTAPVHLAHWGVCITTPTIGDAAAVVRARVAVENDDGGESLAPVTVQTQIYDIGPGGREKPRLVAIGSPALLPGMGAKKTGSVLTEMHVPDPRRWDVSAPYLYLARTSVKVGEAVVDTQDTIFGIRTAAFDAQQGFKLNGRRIPLNGVCNHHDLGPLGSAVNARAIERQLEILKEMGCNAIRTSHNPPAPELLDACDRMGFLVMDEAFDCWAAAKKPNDYHRHFAAWHERDLVALVRRDRNHPSVILWSTGNEVSEQDSPQGHEISRRLTDIIHREDPTRPVSAGCNNGNAGFNGFQKTLDVMGYNYKPWTYEKFTKEWPKQPMFGAETASCVSSRGEYFFPVSSDKSKGFFNFQVSSYDLYAPGWAYPADVEFAAQEKNPTVAGEFVWTGFDYLGEPTPYNLDSSNLLNFQNEKDKADYQKFMEQFGSRPPSRSSYFGIIDLCGFPKDRYYLYQAHWRPDLPMAHILPHWNWPERVGQVTPVHVYTSGDEAELFLNGHSLGRKTKGASEYRLRWDDVTYEPGVLKVVAYRKGQKWAEAVCETTGPASKVALEADRTKLRADGTDLCYVTIKITDAQGRVVPRTHDAVTLTVEGPADLVAVCNGDATDVDGFQINRVKAYNGLAQAILRTRAGEKGAIVLTAASGNVALSPSSVSVESY